METSEHNPNPRGRRRNTALFLSRNRSTVGKPSEFKYQQIATDGFRGDINGLRAWAVAAVVLFHFRVPGFDGGFIGVDVFFVISGFLMTGIILEKLSAPGPFAARDAKPFSLIGFYLARARRILPALIALCAVLLVFGWFFLPNPDYRMLATHVVTALIFISNIKFLGEAGYFDAASHEKLLLHTWSVSVEWQFYLLFPVVLLLLWKLRPSRHFMGTILLAGFCLSLGKSIAITGSSPDAAFYSLTTRIWEMLAGSLVYLYGRQLRPSGILSRGMEALGFGLIIVSIVFFDGSTPWPGWQALVPVAGTVLVILAGRSDSWLSGTALSQWLGKTSYSIYLWHWPLSVVLFYFDMHRYWPAILAALLLTLLLSWISWAYIEQPARSHLAKFEKARQTFFVGAIVLLVGAPAYATRAQDGISGRLKPEVEAIFAQAEKGNPDRAQCFGDSERCAYGGDELAIIVIGDSQGEAIIGSVQEALSDDQQHVLDWTMNGCQTVRGLKRTDIPDWGCDDFLEESLDLSAELDPDVPLLIVNRISMLLEGPNEAGREHEARIPRRYISTPHPSRSAAFHQEAIQGIYETACAFAEHRPVYILRPTPEFKRDVPRVMGRAAMLGTEARVSISMEEYNERHRLAWEAHERAAKKCGATLLDPRPYLCSDDRCWGDIDGLPIYYDDNHLNARGGRLLIPLFRQMLE